MKQQHDKQPEHGGAAEQGGSHTRGPRPAPRVEPQSDAERDRYGSTGKHGDAAGRPRRQEPKSKDGYGEFLRDEEAEDPADSGARGERDA